MQNLILPSGTRFRFIAVGLLTLAFALPSLAQVSSGGTPASRLTALNETVPTIDMPPVDAEAYLLEDELADKDEPFRFGAPIEVSLNLRDHGLWTTLANGDRVWRLRIRSENAHSINLLFDEFFMPAGGRLFIYNDDYRFTIGAFTGYNNKENGKFSTQPVPGDAITLEYIEPAQVSGEGKISIWRVVHAYRNLFGYHEALDDFNDSGWCNNNVACDEEWNDQERGVVMLLSGGFRYCSGSLINNANSDGTPYILTANHCDPGPNDIAMFNYQSPVCTPNQDGPTNMTVSGGSELFHNSTSDGSLWLLSVPVPETYNPYFSGWNAVNEPSTNSVCIHHPSGDVKKITWDNDPTTTTSYLGTSSPGDGTHWRIATWEDGTTEGGSSGSPLFDQNHRIIGQLHGGYANCNNNVNDYYGKFSLSMTLGLRTWLDPENTGVMFVDGYDPNFAGRVEGIVTGGNPVMPLEGVRVQVVGNDWETETEADGSYEIRLPEGTFSLLFSKFGYQDHTESNIVIIEDAVVTRDVFMSSVANGTLTGTVTAGLFLPVQSAEVSIDDTPLPSQFTDADGHFVFTLPGGSPYEVTVSYGDVSVDTTVYVPANASVNVVIYLESAYSQAQTGDAYGYLAYDRFDLDIPPAYEWVEISPSAGGPGTVLTLDGPDYNAYLPLDEPFVFYGQSYDTLTINENGWIAPGYSFHQRNSNTPIPNTAGPEGMLAVFWDNLHDGPESEICWWYDEENCRLIIEYYKMHFLPQLDSMLTCQVHIYSAYSWPTPTGDNEFVYLYQHIGVPESATVGIENQAQTDGLQVLYNGTSGAYSWPVTPGAAILFSTRNAERLTGTLSGSIIAHPNDVDFLNADFYYNCESIQSDASGNFSTTDAFVGNQMIGLELSGYESWSLPAAVSETIPVSVEFEVWRLDPPRNFTAFFDGSFPAVSWDPPLSLSEGYDHFIEYIVLHNGEERYRTDSTQLHIDLNDPLPYLYSAVAVYQGGISEQSNEAEFGDGADDLNENLPIEFALSPAYPNPFNATTTIDFALPHSTEVTLTVFDILGREVSQLFSGQQSAGYHSIQWNADAYATGLYIVRMDTPSFHAVQKL
ncbi:carboxypeptidase regulatory-like domain-containing protein, partial [bacterium]|nr:carboxypeptidase regulatory-like domain-containing protein [bacterium]